MIENLNYINEFGMEEFFTKERSKWRCAECGATICCHNRLCLTCKIETLLMNKKIKVTIYLPEKSRADVLSLSLDHEIKLMIANAKQMGKMKYLPIVFDLCSDEMFETAFQLADFKKSIK